MRVLLIDEKAKEDIRRLREHAHANEYTIDMMLDRMNNQLPPPGDDPVNVCHIHDGFKVVFTIETNGLQKARHMSVSVGDLTKYPSPQAVELLMSEFGFVAKKVEEADRIYLEESVQAVNVVELM